MLVVLKEIWLNVDGGKVADLGAALESEATAGATLEGRPRTIHERKPMIRVRAKRLRSVDRRQREESDRGRGVLWLSDAQARQLDFELFHQSIEHGLELSPRVESTRVIALHLIDGAG